MVQPASLFSFLFLTLHLSVSGVISATFTLVNQCNYTVWPASLTTDANPNLATTGFVLNPGKSSTVTAPATWNGRFWGRSLCTTDFATGNFSCVTGDCSSGKMACGSGAKPPVTLAEFIFCGFNGIDYYDVSLVDGYNVPIEVIPVGGSGNCSSTGCPADLNVVCPTELKVTQNEQVVACQGPCVGNHSTPATCEASINYQIFKSTCPQAYSYASDDQTSKFTCQSADYSIIFCPASNNARLDIRLLTMDSVFIILILVPLKS